MRRFIKNGTFLVPIDRIEKVDYSRIEDLVLLVQYDGVTVTFEGMDALESAMVLNPACLEGKRLQWPKRAWFLHNFVAHPVLQILASLGWIRLGLFVHGVTIPMPLGKRKSL